jgi:hypothetical protein
VDAGEQPRLADAAADESARTALSWPLTCVGVRWVGKCAYTCRVQKGRACAVKILAHVG